MQKPLELTHDPHTYLGLHPKKDGRKLIRLLRPGDDSCLIELRGEKVPLKKISQKGVFELEVDESVTWQDYQVFHRSGLLCFDPYCFWPSIGEVDLYLFGQGVHYRLYEVLGGRETEHQGVRGTRFSVWAPSAKSVFLIGDFNHWNNLANPMRVLGESGIFELFVPGVVAGEKYKFEIITKTGEHLTKADPFALQAEVRPKTASVIAKEEPFAWSDQKWMEARGGLSRPINIYELHLGSWRIPYGRALGYREIAVELAKYCKEMGYTHVEFMPIQEHPLDESWGYQVSGFFAPTSRYGTPDDFRWLVNYLHEANIGVILDWVPGHFPVDKFSLARFDGTALFEHEDPRQGFHPHWNTFIFNFGRKEVSNFLIASALFFFDKMHIDGLRVDAVASMLYLDYGRKEGEWIPNRLGGRENLEAMEFFKHLNSIVHEKYPSILMIAEESTAFPKVTHPCSEGGLGFDMKWNMGWMNDTLRYFSKDPIYRKHHQNDLTFSMLYAFSEKYTLPLSHDEVVHEKKSLLSKMPGDLWQQFANLRLLLSYQVCHPGKKLTFMGGEIGQCNEWGCKEEIDWALLHSPFHRGLHEMVKELNHLYLKSPSLWTYDFDPRGFSWIDFSDHDNSCISYLRKSESEELLCVHHFSPNFHPHYVLKLSHVKECTEVFNSDASRFSGSGKVNASVSIKPDSITFQLSPLATMVFHVRF